MDFGRWAGRLGRGTWLGSQAAVPLNLSVAQADRPEHGIVLPPPGAPGDGTSCAVGRRSPSRPARSCCSMKADPLEASLEPTNRRLALSNATVDPGDPQGAVARIDTGFAAGGSRQRLAPCVRLPERIGVAKQVVGCGAVTAAAQTMYGYASPGN